MLRAIVLVIAACGHAAPPPGPPPGTTHAQRADAGVSDGATPLDEDLPRLAERAVHLYQDWQKALADAGADCAAATAKLNTVADEYADVIAANAKVLKAGRERVKALRDQLAAHQDQLDAAAESIRTAPAMKSCGHDAAFAHAVDRLGGES